MLIATLFLGIILIKLLWILTDPERDRIIRERDFVRSNLIELGIIILQAVAAVAMPLPFGPFTVYIQILGIALYLLGVFFTIWGRMTMRRFWGHPGKVHKDRQTELVTGGAFRYSRNPIYVGFLLIYFGYALAIKSVLIILRIPLAIYFYRSIRKEEVNLEKQFGKTYLAYKKRVPRFLLV